MRNRDPIIEEIRAIRDQIAKDGDYDIEKIAKALKEEEPNSGWKVASHPPKRLTKKAS